MFSAFDQLFVVYHGNGKFITSCRLDLVHRLFSINACRQMRCARTARSSPCRLRCRVQSRSATPSSRATEKMRETLGSLINFIHSWHVTFTSRSQSYPFLLHSRERPCPLLSPVAGPISLNGLYYSRSAYRICLDVHDIGVLALSSRPGHERRPRRRFWISLGLIVLAIAYSEGCITPGKC